MDTEAQYTINEEKYHVVTVEKCVPPHGFEAGDWHRYVIGQGKSEIVGFKCGTLHAVTEHANVIAEDLNNRANNGGSYYASRNRK